MIRKYIPGPIKEVHTFRFDTVWTHSDGKPLTLILFSFVKSFLSHSIVNGSNDKNCYMMPCYAISYLFDKRYVHLSVYSATHLLRQQIAVTFLVDSALVGSSADITVLLTALVIYTTAVFCSSLWIANESSHRLQLDSPADKRICRNRIELILPVGVVLTRRCPNLTFLFYPTKVYSFFSLHCFLSVN